MKYSKQYDGGADAEGTICYYQNPVFGVKGFITEWSTRFATPALLSLMP